MITLLITRYGCPEGVYLRLPATPADIGAVFAELDNYDSDTSTTSILSVESPVLDLGLHIGDADPADGEIIGKLNDLAEKLRDMDEQHIAVLAAALEAEKIRSLDAVLETAEHTDGYILIHGVTTHKQLGEFVVDAGYKSFPANVLPYLDYAVIGAEYISQRGGAFTSKGYVLRKSAEQKQARDRETVFRLTLRNVAGETYELHLPAEESELDEALKRLGIDEFAEASLERTDCIAYLSELIPNDGISVETANELAYAIEQMKEKDGELLKYLAILDAEHPQTFEAAYQLWWDMDDYERIIEGTYEYGQTVLRRLGAEDELIDAIDEYMDFEKFGEDSMQKDDLRHTSFGMLRRVDGAFRSRETAPAAPELRTLKLYMPLTAEMYCRNRWGDIEQQETPMYAGDLLAYESEIISALVKYRTPDETERGIMQWYGERDSVNGKVRSAVFTAEERNGRLWGVAECRIAGTLTPDELAVLKDFITGQAADGWGEGFEQHAVQTDEGEMYVHLWNSDNWSIRTEDELFGQGQADGVTENYFEMEMM